MYTDKFIVTRLNSYLLRFLELYKGKFQADIFRCIPYCLTDKQLEKLQQKIFKARDDIKLLVEDDNFDMNAASLKGSRIKKRVSFQRIIHKYAGARSINTSDFLSDVELYVSNIYDFKQRYFDDIFEALSQITPLLYRNLLDDIQGMLSKNSKKKVESDISRNIAELQKLFKLNDEQVNIIIFFYMAEAYDFFDDLARSDELQMGKLYSSMKLHSRFFKVSPRQLRLYYDKNGPLLKAGLLTKGESGRGRAYLEISNFTAEFIAGTSEQTLLDSFITKDIKPLDLNLDDFLISQKEMEVIQELLRSPGGNNILLYGAPGTGKTEFARTITRYLKKDAYFVNQYDPNGEENLKHRKSAIVAAQNILSPQESVIIIDESDPVLSTRNEVWLCDRDGSLDSKAWTNSIMESSKHKIIWISNQTERIDESTKRRFSYSLRFRPFSAKQREKVWKVQLEKTKVRYIKSEEIKEFASRYQVNAGGIALALQDIKQMKSLKTTKAKKNMLHSILEQHETFLFGKQSKLNGINKNYSLDIVNADSDLNKLIEVLQQFYAISNSSRLECPIANFSILLQGQPGTGKTEFVKYAAEILGRNLLVKRLSDIRSKWYGESLQNIAKMFSDAEEQEAILFLDEADSFFMSRESASQYTGDETNELLTQMENFKGVLFCSTNFVTHMDPAVMRRFNQKIKFGYLQEHAKLKLFEMMLGEIATLPLNAGEIKELGRLEYLTPGDFKVVYQKNFFLGKQNNMTLITELKNEESYKFDIKKRISL